MRNGIASATDELLGGSDDPLDRRQRGVLQVLGVGDRHFGGADPPDGGVELPERALHDPGGDLAADAAGPPPFVHHDGAVGPGDGLQDGLVVERSQHAQVDHLGVDAAGGEVVGGLQALGQRTAVGEQAQVASMTPHRGPADVDGRR
jgi:hypothetical protein